MGPIRSLSELHSMQISIRVMTIDNTVIGVNHQQCGVPLRRFMAADGNHDSSKSGSGTYPFRVVPVTLVICTTCQPITTEHQLEYTNQSTIDELSSVPQLLVHTSIMLAWVLAQVKPGREKKKPKACDSKCPAAIPLVSSRIPLSR